MLKQTFFILLMKYTDQQSLMDELWNEIEKAYANKNRYYHTLKHLENLLEQLKLVKSKIKNWDLVLFSLFYHDVVYQSFKSDNEEKSADFAASRMAKLAIANDVIEQCKNQILATKTHALSIDSDTNFFIDADLSILGSNWDSYSEYIKNVRKEYAMYPNFIYNLGRKKVVKHFLAMEKLFKTDFFHSKFETQAKLNLEYELR